MALASDVKSSLISLSYTDYIDWLKILAHTTAKPLQAMEGTNFSKTPKAFGKFHLFFPREKERENLFAISMNEIHVHKQIQTMAG